MKKSNKYYFIIIIVVILTLILVYKNTNESFQGTGNQQAYDIIVIAGQSNAVGAGVEGTSTYTADQNNTIDPLIQELAHDNITIKPAQERLDSLQTGAFSRNYGVGVSFARAYKDAGKLTPGRQILLINCGWGATGVLGRFDIYGHTNKRWYINNTNDSLYYLSLTRIQSAQQIIDPSSKVVAIIWQQGESDAPHIVNAHTEPRTKNNRDPRTTYTLNTTNKATYKTDVVNLLTTLRSNIGNSNAPILIGGLSHNNFNKPGFTEMNETLQEIGTENSSNNFKYVDTTGLPSQRSSHVHFNKTGSIELGKRMYAAYSSML